MIRFVCVLVTAMLVGGFAVPRRSQATPPPPPSMLGTKSFGRIEDLGWLMGAWSGTEKTWRGDYWATSRIAVTAERPSRGGLQSDVILVTTTNNDVLESVDVIAFDVQADHYKIFLPGFRGDDSGYSDRSAELSDVEQSDGDKTALRWISEGVKGEFRYTVRLAGETLAESVDQFINGREWVEVSHATLTRVPQTKP